MYQILIHMKDDKMQKCQTMCLTETYKKDANGVTCQYTYIIYITHAKYYYPG